MTAPKVVTGLDAVRQQLELRGIGLREKIGIGAAATVFEALDRRHDRRIAVKILDPMPGIDQQDERFAQEIRLIAQFRHPNIVPLYDSGEADGTRYYLMPLASGRSLRARLAEGPVSPAEAVRIARDVAEGLRYAHARGVIHRDIKPGNILLEDGHAFIADFGLAESRDRLDATPSGNRRTGERRFVGTVEYMAPEQLLGGRIDERSDLYALGCTLYEAVTGILPFAADSTADFARLKLAGRFEPLASRSTGVPRPFAELIDRMLATDPNGRPQSAEEVIEALRAVEGRVDLSGRRAWWLVVAVATVALIPVVRLLTRPRLDPRRVAIAAFTNETGRDSLASFGPEASDVIDQALVKAGAVEVVASAVDLPVSSARDSTEVETTPERLARLARETRAGRVIIGSYYLVDNRIGLQVEIVNARTGIVEAAVGPLSDRPDSTAHLAGAMASRVVSAIDSLGGHHDQSSRE